MPLGVRFYDFAEPIEDEPFVQRRSSLSPEPEGEGENVDLPPVDAEFEEPQSQTQLQTQVADGPLPSFTTTVNVAHLWGRLYPCIPDYPTYDLARTKNVYTIGRAKNCDIQIVSPKVSSLHCTITLREDDGEVVSLQDHSRNGTYVRALTRLLRL